MPSAPDPGSVISLRSPGPPRWQRVRRGRTLRHRGACGVHAVSADRAGDALLPPETQHVVSSRRRVLFGFQGFRSASSAVTFSMPPRLPRRGTAPASPARFVGALLRRGSWPAATLSFLFPFPWPRDIGPADRGLSEPLVPSRLSDGNVSAGKPTSQAPTGPPPGLQEQAGDAGKGGTPGGRPGDPAEETRAAPPNALCAASQLHRLQLPRGRASPRLWPAPRRLFDGWPVSKSAVS